MNLNLAPQVPHWQMNPPLPSGTCFATPPLQLVQRISRVSEEPLMTWKFFRSDVPLITLFAISAPEDLGAFWEL